ncbi:Clavaminate synthase-like protein [Aspergillus homomorphus CBS 101889]|uniref:Clavaminate synthase-like protein n=1 Tax=Aspergillus homomorphus (strain CBS 101889) TaxID=1450537 RepID=A0A395HHT3_ASPHC|nr:Clavaminate synthase-like protein [Aspergillus homomorphus CBS 101889]RAL07451.1 Clavaminate synthase-like protein [Aspergillus homomorphus CBS 101889]
MKLPAPELLQQVHVPLNGGQPEPIASFNSAKAAYTQDREAVQESLLRLCSVSSWHKSSRSAFVPQPVLISSVHQRQWKALNEALVLAITDIVENWWTDSESRFPERMPLEPAEEDLLRWIDSQVPDNLPPYRECRGSWRPDFLIEKDNSESSPGSVENFRISEINARFSFNGLMFAACGQQAFKEQGICDGGNGLVGATEPEKFLGGLLSLFNPDLPLHLLKGDEQGVDIHMIVAFLRTRFGISPRFVLPDDLRLVPYAQNKSGYKLCCVVKKAEIEDTGRLASVFYHDGEAVEEIHQVGLELHQREIRALSPEMLRQISLRCFNDMRTILLVHDKRMLGIVRQQLDSLVERNVITHAQAKILDHGIADTILPGSSELEQFVGSCKENPELKQDYILKPIRSGKGDGIVFGEDIDPTEWVSRLEGLRSSTFALGDGICIVQRKINQIQYDLILGPMGVKASHTAEISNILRTSGILKVSLQFEDDSSRYLQKLVQALHDHHDHGLPITHSASRGWFWDIRPNSTTFQTPSHQARSETMEEFPWHTDCSYEEAPPRFFALQVLREDRCGGGTLSVMNVGKLSSLLSPSTCATLLRPEFRINVPPEFVKHDAKRYIVGSLMATGAEGLPSIIRFREDILTPLTAEAALALQELKECLLGLKVQAEMVHLTPKCLPRGSVILMDNYRWIHARTHVMDPERHLRRVRWDARPFSSVCI